MVGAGPALLFSSPEPALVPAQQTLGGFGVKRDHTPPLAYGFKLVGRGEDGKGSSSKLEPFVPPGLNQVCAKHCHSLHSDVLSASLGEEAKVVKASAPVALPGGWGRGVKVHSSDWARRVRTYRGGDNRGTSTVVSKSADLGEGRGSPSGGWRVNFFETGGAAGIRETFSKEGAGDNSDCITHHPSRWGLYPSVLDSGKKKNVLFLETKTKVE